MADQSERTLSETTPESQPEVTMSNIWVISDTHFEHDNIKKLCYRPDDYNEQITKMQLHLSLLSNRV